MLEEMKKSPVLGSRITRVQQLYGKYEKFAPAIFFVLGFLFDMLTLGRIDSVATISQQGVFILSAVALLFLEILDRENLLKLPDRVTAWWQYQEEAIHFFFGSLLSAYALFYFKSASISSSFFFMVILFGLLVANESSMLRGKGIVLRSAILSLCVASYFVYLIPILIGSVGVLPFILSLISSLALLLLVYWGLRRFVEDDSFLNVQYLFPVAGIHLLFALMYAGEVVPPVPISINYMGVYHQIEKKGDDYELSYSRPAWKFWQSGDQDFYYREGDRLYGFVSIFSPTGFKDQVQVRWLRKEGPFLWTRQDAIPMSIRGGREEGFRGYTVKENFTPGKWRMQVETLDGREIGRLTLDIYKDDTNSPRTFRTQLK